jgi:hypothetical protein
LKPKTSVFCKPGYPFYLRFTAIFFPLYFQYYSVMITDPLYYIARGERTFGPEKVNVQ